MTKTEFMRGLLVLEASYQNFCVSTDSVKLGIWYSFFRNLSVQEFEKMCSRYVSTNHYPPTIAGLKEEYTKTRTKSPLTAEESWLKVCEIASERHKERRDALKGRLNPIALKALAIIGGTYMINHSQNVSVTQAQYINTLKSLQEREKEDLALGTVQEDERRLQVDKPKRIALPKSGGNALDRRMKGVKVDLTKDEIIKKFQELCCKE